MKISKETYFILGLIILITLSTVATFGIEGINRPVLPDHNLHYNYGTIKYVDGCWYKTTYFCFDDKSQSINVYYGSKLFDYAMDNIKKGDFVIVVWKYANIEAETFAGHITVKWLERLVKNGEIVFP